MSTQQSKQVGEKRNAPEGTSTPPTKLPKVAEVSKPETSKKTFHHLNHKFLFFVVSEHSGPSDVIAYFQWWSTKDRPLSQKEQNLWNNAFQIIDDQGISGTILFKDNETEEALCVKLSSNYNIPPAPAEIIAAQIHKLKDQITAEKKRQKEVEAKIRPNRSTPLENLKCISEPQDFLVGVVKNCYSLFEQQKIFAPYFALVQSSGAGKTTCMNLICQKFEQNVLINLDTDNRFKNQITLAAKVETEQEAFTIIFQLLDEYFPKVDNKNEICVLCIDEAKWLVNYY